MALKANNNRIIVSRVELCRTLFEKAMGLMFRLPLRDKCLVFFFRHDHRPHFHMLFVFFPIDMAFLDSKKRIVELKSRVRPFVLEIRPKTDCRYVIELPAGTIQKARLKLGDKLGF
jgi:uncharacterized membrane protein (UPF0127 family)